MRKKGEIWKHEFQRLIVSKYSEGMPVSKILELEELKAIKKSEFLIRQILKANKIKTIWQRQKQKEELWKPEVVEYIVALRNEGKSYSEIADDVAKTFSDLEMSRSTVVRILEENSDKLSGDGNLTAEQRKQLGSIIANYYQQGVLVKDIRSKPEIRRAKLSEHSIRTILKEQGVKLTGRKGELRRWPDELQDVVVDLYQEGMTFDEIKQQDSIVANNPTDYAIRTILKRKGVVTRKPSYLQPISETRYRKYRDSKIAEKEISLVHKHLARFTEGRHLMLERMGLKDLPIDDIRNLSELDRDTLKVNAQRWQGFFHWGMQFLYDDGLKKKIFDMGLEYYRAITYLRKWSEENDETRKQRGWQRLQDGIREMMELQQEVLVYPAIRFEIESIEE